ncbi:MAG: CsgG/HfaB family protein [Bacteroidota bacterium]|nr:CsgG/HfaB family protein [Bacteroidota bacterium]
MEETRISTLTRISGADCPHAWITQGTAVLCVLVSCACLMGGCSAGSFVERGKEFLAEGDYASAAVSFERALETGADTAETFGGIGVAYLLGGRADALPYLRLADTRSAIPGAQTFARAVAAQQVGSYAEAADAYERASRNEKLAAHRGEIARVVAALRKKDSVVRTDFGGTKIEAVAGKRILAVLPVAAGRKDTSLALAAVGLTDFLTTDLSKASAVAVVERSRLAEVLIELERDTSAWDPATLPEKGRLLAAEILIDPGVERQRSEIVLSARAVSVRDGRIMGAVRERGKEERLFSLEKKIALSLLKELNIPLTATERREIQVPQTENTLAFFAYCRGLRAWDAGRYEEAAGYFVAALREDPAFELARRRYEAAETLAEPIPSLRNLLLVFFPAPRISTAARETLLETGARLLEAGFLNTGAARRDGPQILPLPPEPNR